MDFAASVLYAPAGKTHLFYMGQAGFIIKSQTGRLLAVDLYLSNCVERVEGSVGYKRLLPYLLSPQEIRFDVLIATHAHRDHFDMDSVPALVINGITCLFASEGCRHLIEQLEMDFAGVRIVSPGERNEASGFGIEFVECDHGEAAPDAFGVVIEVDGKKIYMTGDTCLRMDWVEKMREKGPFDVLIGPINGAFGNMNETEFAIYATAIGAKRIVPCHYGMFADHGGNPGRFLDEMRKRKKETACCLMAFGERIVL